MGKRLSQFAIARESPLPADSPTAMAGDAANAGKRVAASLNTSARPAAVDRKYWHRA